MTTERKGGLWPYAKMNPLIKARWIDALRSGDYEQGRGCLCRDGKHCCLGVLCDLMDRGSWVRGGAKLDDGTSCDAWEVPGECTLYATLTSRVLVLCGLDRNASDELMRFNDSGGWDFASIADWIDTNL